MNPTSHFSDHSASPPPSPPRSPAPAPGPSYEDDLEWLFAQVAEQNLQMAKEDANSTSYEITDSVTGLSSGIKLAMRGNRRVKITFKNLRAGKSALDSFADLKLRRDAANFKGKTKASRDSKKKAKTTPGLDDDEIKPDLARRARSHCTVFLCVLLLVWKLTSFFRSPSHQPPARRLALPPRELSELRPHLRHPPPRRRQAPLLHLQRDELWRQCLRLGQRAPLGGVALVDRLELVRRLHREDVLSSSCSSLHLQPPPTLVNSLVSAYPDITDASPPPSLHPAFRSYP